MASYSDIRKGCSRTKYAAGGRVVGRSGNPAKTVINIVVPPAGGMPAGAPPALNSPSGAPGAPPVPPAAAAMALGQMQGKPGAPGAFANGGTPRPAPSTKKAGAEGARGRLQKTASAKARGKRPGEQIK